MSDVQLQTIKDVIKMTPRISLDCLNSIKILMEKEILMVDISPLFYYMKLVIKFS